MKTTASLGYVIIYVGDVDATLSFYEKAFGLPRRFFNDENGMAYGELETGAARLAFANHALAETHINDEFIASDPDRPPLGFEVALVTDSVDELFQQAISAGATKVSEPETKPWGQIVAYVRDCDGNLVELCTPIG